MQKNLFFFLLLVTVLAGACRKGESPDEHYFGRIKVTVVNLPGAGKADIFIDTEKMGEINPATINNLELLLPASKTGKLKIVDQATSTVIADSNVLIIPNIKQEFRVGYSESLGIKGFISDVEVPSDSIRVQVLYNIKKPFNNYPEVEVQLINLFGEDAGIVFENLRLDDPTPHFYTFPRLGEGDFSPGYFFKMKDLKTGEYITDGTGSMFWPFIIGQPDYYGHYLFININDDMSTDAINNYFQATVTAL